MANRAEFDEAQSEPRSRPIEAAVGAGTPDELPEGADEGEPGPPPAADREATEGGGGGFACGSAFYIRPASPRAAR
jgi:hypothetical protein